MTSETNDMTVEAGAPDVAARRRRSRLWMTAIGIYACGLGLGALYLGLAAPGSTDEWIVQLARADVRLEMIEAEEERLAAEVVAADRARRVAAVVGAQPDAGGIVRLAGRLRASSMTLGASLLPSRSARAVAVALTFDLEGGRSADALLAELEASGLFEPATERAMHGSVVTFRLSSAGAPSKGAGP